MFSEKGAACEDGTSPLGLKIPSKPSSPREEWTKPFKLESPYLLELERRASREGRDPSSLSNTGRTGSQEHGQQGPHDLHAHSGMP